MTSTSVSGRNIDDEPGIVRRLLSTPLIMKLVIADLAINVLALVVLRRAPYESSTEILAGAFVVTLILNGVLVYWALRPLQLLEVTAKRVSDGDLDARFSPPLFSDRNLRRIGATFNALLDSLTADRARVQHLASEVISAGDRERANIARELHDSTAQSLAALELMLTSALRDPQQGTPERIGQMRDITAEALSEVRTLSHNVHPRVLDDLGLVAALEHLARRTRETSKLGVWVSSDVHDAPPPAAESVLYRVAQSALSNIAKHADATEVYIAVTAKFTGDTREAVMSIRDNGAGFSVREQERLRRGMGLFIMRERLALLGGVLEVVSTPGGGTVVIASVPYNSVQP